MCDSRPILSHKPLLGRLLQGYLLRDAYFKVKKILMQRFVSDMAQKFSTKSWTIELLICLWPSLERVEAWHGQDSCASCSCASDWVSIENGRVFVMFDFGTTLLHKSVLGHLFTVLHRLDWATNSAFMHLQDFRELWKPFSCKTRSFSSFVFAKQKGKFVARRSRGNQPIWQDLGTLCQNGLVTLPWIWAPRLASNFEKSGIFGSWLFLQVWTRFGRFFLTKS